MDLLGHAALRSASLHHTKATADIDHVEAIVTATR